MSDPALEQISATITENVFKLTGIVRVVPARWSRRMRTTIASTHHMRAFGHIWIKVNWRAWPILTEEQRAHVLAHESAHVAEYIRFGSAAHGRNFRAYMRTLGCDSRRRLSMSDEQHAALKGGR